MPVLASQSKQSIPKPIAELRARGIEVYVRATATVPSFSMPYTNATHDVDVSGQMQFAGSVELGLTQAAPSTVHEALCHPSLPL